MAGCRSCTGQSADRCHNATRKAEKLEKGKRSDNPRYPHIFVGNQAIYTDDSSQMIVTVLNDECDEARDCFTLKPNRILKDTDRSHAPDEPFDVSQPAEEKQWKLAALI
jgi:hypothetical protein